MILKLDDVVVRYDNAIAVDAVSFDVAVGERVALIGANGAGKTSLVNAIAGLVKVHSGHIQLNGKLGIVPEGRQLFGGLSVEDNVMLGGWKSKNRNIAPMYELFPDLYDRRSQTAETLSGGQQQMVSIARALMAQPDLLVIDELSLGLAPRVVQDLAQHLQEIYEERGTSLLLIEQEVGLAFSLCTRALVMETGRIVLKGSTDELAQRDDLAQIYLGGSLAAASGQQGGDQHE